MVVKDIFDFKFEDFELQDYTAHPAIKASVAVQILKKTLKNLQKAGSVFYFPPSFMEKATSFGGKHFLSLQTI